MFLALTFVLAMVGPIYCNRDSEETGEAGDERSPVVVETAPNTPEASQDASRETAPAEPAGPETAGQSPAEVAVAYARTSNPSLPELAILGVNTVGEWSLVTLQPVDKSADAAAALLKNVGGKWTVIDFGLVLPENHPDAPPEVFR